jgi:high-affinity iron transporter
MAVTSGVAGRTLWIAGGVAAGVLGACAVALFTSRLSALFGGSGQELFNASILSFAVLMLAWHNIWMARHGRELAAEIRAAGQAVVAGSKSLAALSMVVAIAVLREGSEVVLFLYGVAMSSHEGPLAMFAGGVLGMLGAALLSYLLYRGLVAIPVRYLFSVTNWLIALLAAGMAGQAAAILAGADILPSWGDTLWDTSFILSDDGWIGAALHALVGYSARPSGIQIAAYLATLSTLILLTKFVAPTGPRKPATAPVHPVPESR